MESNLFKFMLLNRIPCLEGIKNVTGIVILNFLLDNQLKLPWCFSIRFAEKVNPNLSYILSAIGSDKKIYCCLYTDRESIEIDLFKNRFKGNRSIVV